MGVSQECSCYCGVRFRRGKVVDYAASYAYRREANMGHLTCS